ncbi:MAG: hypothetical protein V7746_25535 [Halioglobus sp.]
MAKGITEHLSTLDSAARNFGTPCYVYFADDIRQRAKDVHAAFPSQFHISYAVKANPNPALLGILLKENLELDVSSIGEFRRGIEAGFDPANISFTGPAKKEADIREAVEKGIGYIVCESSEQLRIVERCAKAFGCKQDVLIRINPVEVPKGFGLQMGGRPSQFGIDEEQFEVFLSSLRNMHWVRVQGLHIFSGGNSLNTDAVIENFSSLTGVFRQLCESLDISPRRLVYGSGFGIPYFEGDTQLDIAAVSKSINAMASELKGSPRFGQAQLVLEMGRYLVGSQGYMLTSVVDKKNSRGTDICLLDAGFNNHLNAAGMMGAVMRRDWPFWNISQSHPAVDREYQLVGPLCASFDVLANKAKLPETSIGDILAVGSSGAYGLTASPTRFISHPEPLEILVEGRAGSERLIDISVGPTAAPLI